MCRQNTYRQASCANLIVNTSRPIVQTDLMLLITQFIFPECTGIFLL